MRNCRLMRVPRAIVGISRGTQLLSLYASNGVTEVIDERDIADIPVRSGARIGVRSRKPAQLRHYGRRWDEVPDGADADGRCRPHVTPPTRPCAPRPCRSRYVHLASDLRPLILSAPHASTDSPTTRRSTGVSQRSAKVSTSHDLASGRSSKQTRSSVEPLSRS
jgi:hypothetical protein